MTEHSASKAKLPSYELLPLVFALLVVLFIAWLSYNAWSAFGASREETEVTQRVLSGTNALLSALKDAETGQRGFLLTGDDQYLSPYRRALTDVPVLLSDLSNATGTGHPDQTPRLEKLKPLVREKLEELAL